MLIVRLISCCYYVLSAYVINPHVDAGLMHPGHIVDFDAV